MEDFDHNFLWGETTEAQEEEKVPKEIGDLVILSAIKKETPKQKQPQPQPTAANDVTIGPELSTMEENVLYTIKLIQYARKLAFLIASANSWNEGISGNNQTCPPMPYKSACIREKQKKGNFPQHHIERRNTPFFLGEPIYVPYVGKEIAKEILYKTVATICAHAGFDTAMQRPLQTLTDVAGNYLQKFCGFLRFAVDKESMNGSLGFPDSIERVFYDMGIGSMISVHDFYQRRILQYRDQWETKCLCLVRYYQALLPSINTETDNSEMECDEEIPELHFPATAEGGCEDELQSSLEPGFQMLQSLEEQEVGIKYQKEVYC